jgi:AcrR family transcriptional regulator
VKDAYKKRKRFIIEAAKKVVVEQGFNKLTFRSVAQEANISPGTLYYYYNSKNEILYDILDSTTRELNQLYEKIEKGLIKEEDIANRLFKLTVNHIKNVDRNKIFLHLINESLSKDNNLSEKLVDKYNSWLEGFEKVFQLHFNIPAPESHCLAILYDALVDGLVIKQLLGLDSINQPEVEQLFKLFFNRQFSELLDLFH